MNLQRDIILAPYTTYKIGGPADLFIEATTRKELIDALQYALDQKVPYFILGIGANILISDKGFRGLVIKNSYKDISFNDENVHIGSGALIANVINKTKDRELSGFEHFAGIPSTIGGALWQNLHFLNPKRDDTLYIAEIVVEGRVFNMITRQEEILSREDFKFGYDTSILHEGNRVLLDATFKLKKSENKIIQKQMDANLAWRQDRHPPVVTEPSCGSVFKKILYNNEIIAAAKLIDEAGLKGYKTGDIIVSLKHPNFLTHTGAGTAEDVRRVIKHVQDVVYGKYGVYLETEIGMVGEF